jgi:hypothetical protein
VGARPTLRCVECLAGHAGRAHAERREDALAHRLGIRLAGHLLDDLGRRIVGDVLVGVALAGRADRRDEGELAAQQAGIVAVLELGIVGVAGEAEAVREDVGDGRLLLVAAGQANGGAVFGDRLVEVDLPFGGENRNHVAGDALRHRGPAEDGVDADRLARSGDGFAIALEEADLAVLDDADGEADHRALPDEPLEPLVDARIIDDARRRALALLDGGELLVGDAERRRIPLPGGAEGDVGGGPEEEEKQQERGDADDRQGNFASRQCSAPGSGCGPGRRITRRPGSRIVLPDPDTLFRRKVKLPVAHVERLVPGIEVPDRERPDEARRVAVDGEQLLEQLIAVLGPPHLPEAQEEALIVGVAAQGLDRLALTRHLVGVVGDGEAGEIGDVLAERQLAIDLGARAAPRKRRIGRRAGR